jgi:transcriptional regulator GlxA family with amidase domain
MHVSLICIDGLFDTGLMIIMDILGLANNLSKKMMDGKVHFDVTLVGLGKSIKTSQGFSIPVKPITADVKADWVIMPALTTSTPELLLGALERKDVRTAIRHLRNTHEQGTQVGAACLGAFFLAEAGLLDDREATTTWWLAPLFRQRYPDVRLDETRMLVYDKGVVTAGAAMGHLDLALWLVRQSSPELADIVSRYMLTDVRTSQAPYIIPSHLAQADPLILDFERWSRKNLKQGFSLQTAASALNTSTRTLQRRCEAVLGKSPLSYFQDLRVEHARGLISGSDMDIEEIAAQVGYEDGATLRTLLRQRLGRGVRELRAAQR